MRWRAFWDGNLLARCLMHHAWDLWEPTSQIAACLVAEEHAYVSVGVDGMEVGCKTEQQVKADPAGKQLDGSSSQHTRYQHHLQHHYLPEEYIRNPAVEPR